MNRILNRLPLACYILIAVAVLLRFVPLPDGLFPGYGLYQLFFIAAQLLCLYYLYITGRLRKSPLRKAFIIFIPLYALGALMKLQHWMYGMWVIPAVLAGIAVLYGYWTLRKSPRRLLDYLKLCYLAFNALRVGLVFSHSAPQESLFVLEFLNLAFLALLVYLNDQRIQRSIRAAKIDAFYNDLR